MRNQLKMFIYSMRITHENWTTLPYIVVREIEIYRFRDNKYCVYICPMQYDIDQICFKDEMDDSFLSKH